MSTLTAPIQRYVLTDNDQIMGEGETKYVLRVRDLPIEEKPREKMLLLGVHSLSHAELMAVLLSVGTRKEEVMAMSARILREYGEQAIFNEKNPARLAESLDIPLTKACQIIASFELGRRAYQHKAGKPVFIRTSKQAYQHVTFIGNLQKEQLRGLYLNSRYQIIHEEVISIGSLTANIVHPREVFQPAIEHGAVAVIIAHNHPSGVLDPTEDDLLATEQLVAAGTILGIELLDHLIIGKKNYRSVMENNNE
jgi:DNA repair protein RadC